MLLENFGKFPPNWILLTNKLLHLVLEKNSFSEFSNFGTKLRGIALNK